MGRMILAANWTWRLALLGSVLWLVAEVRSLQREVHNVLPYRFEESLESIKNNVGRAADKYAPAREAPPLSEEERLRWMVAPPIKPPSAPR